MYNYAENNNFWRFACKMFTRDLRMISNNNIDYKVINKHIRSSTAIGSTRYNTTTESREHNESIMKEEGDDAVYVFMYGNVDVVYTIPYKLFKLKIEVNEEEYMKDIIDKYTDNVKNYIDNGYNILICGVNPFNKYRYKVMTARALKCHIPISYGRYHNISKKISYFNKYLENICKVKNIPYFDLVDETSDVIDGTVIVKKEFIGGDNHFAGAEFNIKNYIRNDPNYGKHTYDTFINKLISVVKILKD